VIFIDSDNLSTTGYQNDEWQSSGMDYAIGSSGTIYHSKANTNVWSWQNAGSATSYTKRGNITEVKILKSTVKLNGDFKIGVQLYTQDWDSVGVVPSNNPYLSNTNGGGNNGGATDTIKPVITLNGNKTITLNLNDPFTDLGAKAVDNVDGDITALIRVSGNVDTTKAGTYRLTYSVSDSAGNKASVIRTVVVKDNNVGGGNTNSIYILNPSKQGSHVLVYDNDPSGAHYRFESDSFVGRGGKVLALYGDGMDNAFHILGYDVNERYVWNEHPEYQNKFNISWDSKFDDDYIIYVVLKFVTADGKVIWNDLVYGPSSKGYSYSEGFLYIPLGKGAKDGKWHHYKRNILQDLHRFYPGATIHPQNYEGYVNGFAVRGSGKITNIVLSK
jgi:hypothetical protein